MIDPNDIVKSMQIDSLTADEQMQLLSGIEKSIKNSRVQRQEAVKGNVDVVVNLLKKIEGDIRSRYDEVGDQLVTRISSIKDGKDGKDGKNGKDGKDGVKGDKGDRGLDGRNGEDGVDGVSVTDAKIDFDGSLIISLSTGQEINVGEVVSSDLADKIQVISTMSTNGAVGIKDEGTSISTGVKNINFVGASVTATNSGDDVTVNVSAGTGTVTSVAATVPAFLSVAGSPVTTSGTLAITLSGTALPIANGGTGATTLAGASIVTYTGTETLTNKTFTGYTETVFALGTSGTINLNPANGTIQTCALTGNPTFTASFSSGQSLTLRLTNGSTYPVTWPTTVWVSSAGNVAPTLSNSATLVFWYIGSTLYGAYVGSFV